MKPNKESLAYAEKMRKAERRRKIGMATVKFSDLGAMIREAEQYRSMDASFGGQSAREEYERQMREREYQRLVQQKMDEAYKVTQQAIAFGVTGPGISVPEHPYWVGDTVTIVNAGAGYTGTPSVSVSVPKSSPVSRKELDEANAEIERLKAEISERDEIIDALVSDASEAEALREENEALKAMIEPGLATMVLPDDDGWIEWDGGEVCPVPLGVTFEARIRCGVTGKCVSPSLRWDDSGIVSDIVAYRIVE